MYKQLFYICQLLQILKVIKVFLSTSSFEFDCTPKSSNCYPAFTKISNFYVQCQKMWIRTFLLYKLEVF